MEWFKTYQDGVLRGSLATTNNTTQLIWVKLLAIQNETRLRDGWLHYSPGRPMPREYLAMVCNVTLEELDLAIKEFQGDLDKDGHSRIDIAPDGDIFIKNWEKYQAKPEKTVAKEIAREKARETKHRQEVATNRLIEVTNLLNARLKKIKYQVTGEGEVLDTETGQLISVEELKKLQGGS